MGLVLIQISTLAPLVAWAMKRSEIVRVSNPHDFICVLSELTNIYRIFIAKIVQCQRSFRDLHTM
ncbi:hypothetical protein L484_028089 [Morus notabilis]|uniref:Secreted protein n=1 Tax=Morus notabilis TaxID=981085 RepID=W9SIF9_9ROSA|nr:hypothetical protein L484_028089 [Morus notabilis]